MMPRPRRLLPMMALTPPPKAQIAPWSPKATPASREPPDGLKKPLFEVSRSSHVINVCGRAWHGSDLGATRANPPPKRASLVFLAFQTNHQGECL